jgi:hypothetical protein
MKNLMTSLDRTYRFVLRTRMEHLEHVLRRIPVTFTSSSIVKKRFLEFSRDIVWDMKNLMTSLDRIHRVVRGTRMEHWEHVPRRIVDGITRIGH